MGLVEEALVNNFLPKILGLESISGSLRKLMDLGDKREELGIPNPTEVSDKIHTTSLACSELLVDSLIIGEALYTS